MIQTLIAMAGGAAIGFGCRVTIADRILGIMVMVGLIMLWTVALANA